MLSNPVYDPYQILTKIYSEGAHLKQAIADTYIEEINRARTVKIVYGVLENDLYFDFCIRRYAPKAPKLAVRTLLKISLYMLLFMDKPRYMVTDSAVELCKKLGKSGVSGFVNAFCAVFPRGNGLVSSEGRRGCGDSPVVAALGFRKAPKGIRRPRGIDCRR